MKNLVTFYQIMQKTAMDSMIPHVDYPTLSTIVLLI